MSAFIIAIVITVVAAWLIIKNYQPQTYFAVSGAFLVNNYSHFLP